MDLTFGQKNLLLCIAENDGVSLPKRPNSDANFLYVSGFIDITKKANGEFYEVTDAGRKKIKEFKTDSLPRLFNIFEQHKDCPKNVFESDKVHKLMKPIYDVYLKMIKDKDLAESKLLAFEFMDEMHVMFAQARLMDAMYKRKNKKNNI